MGGTFDPPHLGHLISAENVMKELCLDKVIFVPTGNIYYKNVEETADSSHRYEMVRLSLIGRPAFEISDIEVKKDGYSYTCDTLEKLKAVYPDSDLYFIVGADSLDYMEKWKNPEKVFSLAKIVAVGRKGFSQENNREKAEELKKLYKGDIILLETENIDISSTEIRKAAREGTSFKDKVYKEVYEYILKNNLYKNGDTNDGD